MLNQVLLRTERALKQNSQVFSSIVPQEKIL